MRSNGVFFLMVFSLTMLSACESGYSNKHWQGMSVTDMYRQYGQPDIVYHRPAGENRYSYIGEDYAPSEQIGLTMTPISTATHSVTKPTMARKCRTVFTANANDEITDVRESCNPVDD